MGANAPSWKDFRKALMELSEQLGSMRAVGRATGITATTLMDYVNVRGRMPNADMLNRLVEPLWDDHEGICRRLIAASGYPPGMFLPSRGTLDGYNGTLALIAERHGIPVEEVVEYLIEQELKREEPSRED